MDVDDLTPADPPGAAVGRLARHQRDVCEALDRVGPMLDAAPRADRAFVLERLIELVKQARDGFDDCLARLTEQLDLETVFRRKDRP